MSQKYEVRSSTMYASPQTRLPRVRARVRVRVEGEGEGEGEGDLLTCVVY